MTSRDSIGRRLLRVALRAIFPLAFTLLAAAMGYLYAILPVRYYVGEAARTETVGDLVPREARSAVAQAYRDPDWTIQHLDDFSWAVPTTLTPFVGHAPRPGQQHNARINRFQLRGEREPVLPKPAGIYRIFLTGASVAFGSGAPSDDRTIGGYLQKILDAELAPVRARRYEVFTLASPGWSSTHERIAIENRLSELEPDLVVSLSGGVDVWFGATGSNVLWARALSDQYYWNLVDAALRRAGFSAMVDVADTSRRPETPETVARRIEKNARLSTHALALAGGDYRFFLQPNVLTTGKPLTRREHLLLTPRTEYFRGCYRAMDDRLRRIEDANYRYINLVPVFDGFAADDEIFVDTHHVGDKGNEVIARSIVESIRDGI